MGFGTGNRIAAPIPLETLAQIHLPCKYNRGSREGQGRYRLPRSGRSRKSVNQANARTAFLPCAYSGVRAAMSLAGPVPQPGVRPGFLHPGRVPVGTRHSLWRNAGDDTPTAARGCSSSRLVASCYGWVLVRSWVHSSTSRHAPRCGLTPPQKCSQQINRLLPHFFVEYLAATRRATCPLPRPYGTHVHIGRD